MLLRKRSFFVKIVAPLTTLLVLTVYQSYVTNMSYVNYWRQMDSLKAGTRRVGENLTMTTAQEEGNISPNCTPQKKFIFIKTHKTGTCTTINIFQRYAIYHKLKVLMPVGQGTLSWPFPPREEDYTHTPDEQYDALMHHFVYNKTWLLTKFPPETKYISIIREPFSHLKSSMNYYHLPRILELHHTGNPVQTFLQDPRQFRNKSEIFFPHVNVTWDGTRNPITFDLGWPTERADDEEETRTYINKLDTEFTLVMILEHLDESVVLLRRLMCWELRDVIYYSVKKNQRGYLYKKYMGTPEELVNHRRWSAIDYMLYGTFNKSLWRKINAQGPDFYDELQHFRTVKETVSSHCNRTRTEIKRQALVVNASKWNPEFVVDYMYCWYITRTRTSYLDVKMRGRRYTKRDFKYEVLDQIINLRLLRRGLPSFRNRHEAHAAGVKSLRRKKDMKIVL